MYTLLWKANSQASIERRYSYCVYSSFIGCLMIAPPPPHSNFLSARWLVVRHPMQCNHPIFRRREDWVLFNCYCYMMVFPAKRQVVVQCSQLWPLQPQQLLTCWNQITVTNLCSRHQASLSTFSQKNILINKMYLSQSTRKKDDSCSTSARGWSKMNKVYPQRGRSYASFKYRNDFWSPPI